MAYARERARTRVTVVFLIGLLLVPLALHGHSHAAQEAHGRLCGVCLVAHHSPVVSSPAVAAAAARFREHVIVPLAAVPATQVHRSPRAGRAPPRIGIAAA
jgi:hypothetical protein